MRSRNSIYNLIAAMILQIVTLLSGLILPRLMILAFGSEVNGLVSSIRQFVGYLSLVEAGLAGACIFSLYKPLSEKDYLRVNRLLAGTKRFYNQSGSIFSILAICLAILFPFITESSEMSYLQIFILVLIVGINGALEFFSMGKYRVLLTADQRGYIISIVQTITQILNCIIIFTMIYLGSSIIAVQLVATLSYFIRSYLLSLYVKKNYTFINFDAQSNSISISQRWDVVFHQIGSMVIFNSPVALITLFCTLTDVSIYTIYNMVFSGISGILAIFNTALVASIGEIISRDDFKTLQNVYREYECGYYMLITWVYSCTFILILPFITLYTRDFTDANYINPNLASLFIFIGILNALRIPQSTIVNAAGHYKETRYRALLEVIINIVMSIILVKTFGMIGVLLGGVCSYLYRTIDFIIYSSKNITKISITETLIRISRMLIIIAIIIIPFYTWKEYFNINSFISWIKCGIIIAIWAGIVTFVGNYIFDKKEINRLIQRLILTVKK